MGQDDGTAVKYFLIRIPFRSYAYFKKVGPKVIENLEQKFKYPIIVIANRTIQSKRAKTHQSQKRPRSRTLKAVHNALLNDIVVPSSITAVPPELLPKVARPSVSSWTHSISTLSTARLTAWPTPMPSLPPTRSLSNSPSQLHSRRRSSSRSARERDSESLTALDAYDDDDELMRVSIGSEDYLWELASEQRVTLTRVDSFWMLVP